MTRKRIINDYNFFNDEQGDIIDKVTKEHEYLEKISHGDTELKIESVIDFYHKKLYENTDALLYLEKLGLKKQANYERFKIGFSDGKLINSLSKKQIQALKKHVLSEGEGSGLIMEGDADYFNNCITFPIFNDSGKLSSIYGLDTTRNEFLKPIYLNSEIPIFNEKASKVYDEVILTENIIDALSLIELEIENVISINDSSNITARHIKLLQDNRVKTIVLSIQNELTADILKDLFIQEGFSIKVIHSPKPHLSWNEALQSNIERNQITKAIIEAETFTPEEKESFKVFQQNGFYIFQANDITYKLTGVKDIFVTNLRVHIKAEHQDGRFEHDNLDLYSAQARDKFASRLAVKFEIEPKRIDKDLNKILDYLERENLKKLNPKEEKDEYMTDEEIEIGMSFLKSKDLFHQIIKDMEVLGYIGEDINKQIVYLVGISRLLSKPLSIFIQSGPSTGKSYLLETYMKLLPDESVEWISSFSDQSFNYMEEGDFLDRIFMIGEALHNEIVEGHIRQMQSENKISRMVTIKDPKTGNLRSIIVKNIVRLVFMMTSTALKANVENISRCIVLHVDESAEQTAKVHEIQRHKSSFDGYLEDKHLAPQVIKKHKCANRLLKKVRIFNPFVKYIKFPSNRTIARRGQKQFLSLIDSICIFRQMQKDDVEKLDYYTNQKITGKECDYYDYELARKLFIEGGLLQNDGDLPAGMIMLYENIRKMVRKRSKKENLKPEEITFIQTDVREITYLSSESVKRYMRMLVEYEYLQIEGGKRHGTRYCYRLREDKPIKEFDISEMIPTVEEIKEMMEKDKNK